MDDTSIQLSPKSNTSSSSGRAASQENEKPVQVVEPDLNSSESDIENGEQNNKPAINKIHQTVGLEQEIHIKNQMEQGEEPEDLSDVSDTDSIDFVEEHQMSNQPPINDLREKLEKRDLGNETSNGITGTAGEKDKENDEDVLDFEAEEGECVEVKEAENLEDGVLFCFYSCKFTLAILRMVIFPGRSR